MSSPRIKSNESVADRIIRVVIGILAYLIGYSSLIGTAQVVAYVIGAIALITAITGFCPLYMFLGISTKKSHKQN